MANDATGTLQPPPKAWRSDRSARERARTSGSSIALRRLRTSDIDPPGLNGKSALSGIGNTDFKRQVLGNFGFATETMQSGGGEDDRFVASFAQLSYAGVDVTTQVVTIPEVRPNCP